jgi:hypothetical protein
MNQIETFIRLKVASLEFRRKELDDQLKLFGKAIIGTKVKVKSGKHAGRTAEIHDVVIWNREVRFDLKLYRKDFRGFLDETYYCIPLTVLEFPDDPDRQGLPIQPRVAGPSTTPPRPAA